MVKNIEPVIIEAVDDDNCLNYVKKDRKGEWVDVKEGEQIGVEAYNPRTRQVELLLFDDIKVGDNPKDCDIVWKKCRHAFDKDHRCVKCNAKEQHCRLK